MWLVFAILSSVFAALTSILAKVGIDGVNSNLATAIRTLVVLIMAWAMVFLTNNQSGITEIGKKSWIFLILSGLATGASCKNTKAIIKVITTLNLSIGTTFDASPICNAL